jgi:two-component system, LytTR family, response regulator
MQSNLVRTAGDFRERRLERPSPRRLAVRNQGRVLFLAPEEIEWIEAAGNYVRLNAGEESYVLRETMSRIEAKLPRGRFLRIHRSAIVNLDTVRELVPGAHGDFLVVLRGGQRLPLARGCRERLEEALGTG